MSEIAEFKRLLGKRMGESISIQTAFATCKSVDWDKKTMTAVGQVDNLEYYDVKLGTGHEFKKPKVDTLCLIGMVENQPANAYLIDAEELDLWELTDSTGFKVILNEGVFLFKDADGNEVKLEDETLTLMGDQFDGIVKADELKTQVDKNTAVLQAIQQAIQTWTPVSQDGGAAFKTALASVPSMQVADLSNIKNERVKHG